MSSFFTIPASQRKRKRTDTQSRPAAPKKRPRTKDDDSISGSDLSDDDARGQVADEEISEDEDEDFQDEDVASKRIRLAEQYLANTEKEIFEDGGFDAADVDKENLRRRMGERLKEDTAESKGKLYRYIAEGLDWRGASSKVLRSKDISKCYTGVAVHGKYVYAVSKDMHLVKWEAPKVDDSSSEKRPTTNWKVVARTRGNRKEKQGKHHHAQILCVAVSPDGRFVVTGGADNKLIVWDAATLKSLRVFTQHRDSVMAIAFRRGTNQLFSASKDRTVKIFSLNELAYIETLFGHQDEVVGVSALAQEKCVTVGARDRTARLWKVVDESQLVFRGGGAPGTHKALESLRKAYEDDSRIEMQEEAYNEGSMDQIAMIDDDTFVTASDNGSMSLWNINKKKAVYTLRLAHGVDPAVPLDQASAEQNPDETMDEKSRGGKQPRWVTALAVVPFSDIVVTGSWDGYIRAWKISQDRRRIEPLGAVGVVKGDADSLLESEGLSAESLRPDVIETLRETAGKSPRTEGIINSLAIAETGERGKESFLVAAAVGREHRFARWREIDDGKNHVVLFTVARKTLSPGGDDDVEEDKEGQMNAEDDFEGFG